MAQVCISGGGTGIGRAIALGFAEDGAEITVVGRRSAPLESVVAEAHERAASSARAMVADLANVEGTAAFLDAIRGTAFDVVVANAGGNAALGAGDRDEEPWRRRSREWTSNFHTNVLTAVHLVEGLSSVDAIADGGAVILISSIAAHRGSGTGSYGGSKAALHPYAVDLGHDLGGRGIRVNVIAPGFIDDTEFFRGGMTSGRRAMLRGQTMTGRVGVPDDVASLVRWLASPQASHISGQVLGVNGGAHPGL